MSNESGTDLNKSECAYDIKKYLLQYSVKSAALYSVLGNIQR